MAREASSHPWAAEIRVSGECVAALIEQQFPELGSVKLEPIGEGWDNVAYLANDRYVFRFPRRTVSAKLIETEARVLPLIAGRLSLAISVPTMLGKPFGEYPWPFAGYRKLDGFLLSAKRPAEEEYKALAAPLGTFLRSLHSLAPKRLLDAGLTGDQAGRFNYARTIEKLGTRLRDLESAGLLAGADRILDFARSLAPIAPRKKNVAVVHGDLYARHIVVNDKLEPTAIIDWGDVHFGDPAIDLSVAYATIPPGLRSEFFAAYGAVDDLGRRLARYRAIYSSAVLAHYGHHIGDADLTYVGRRGLRIAQV